MAKTEGNGCVNDFSRGLATQSLALCLAEKLGTSPASVKAQVAIIMSGGCEGAISPHILVFAVSQTTPDSRGVQQDAKVKRLALGVAFTKEFLPEEQGREAQIKCPLLTKERIADSARRGAQCATNNTYASMAMSRGASALGVALALGEQPGGISDEHVCRAWQHYSDRASCSAGIELLRNEVLVMVTYSPQGMRGQLWVGCLRAS
ncbi:hypothetical protein WJX73_005330 [Symbiochloris irregularis]|uniref:Uncharacterized protein n=1 Tax=Symbiochloris irregularis TaxID=706552 RepID=A0AAW1NT51_9CHLO